jgi:protein TIF31
VSTLGAEHRLTLNELGNQAMYYMECNQPNEAVAILEEIIPVSEKSLGIEDSQTLIAISNLALAYKATDRSDDALRNFEIVLDRWPRKTGNKMPSLTKTLKHFIELLMLTGDVEKSKLYQEKLNELEKSNASNM